MSRKLVLKVVVATFKVPASMTILFALIFLFERLRFDPDIITDEDEVITLGKLVKVKLAIVVEENVEALIANEVEVVVEIIDELEPITVTLSVAMVKQVDVELTF
jgi:hypothetical protein